MKKSAQIVFMVFSLVMGALVLFLCFYMLFGQEKPTTSPEPITKINQTYEGSWINATAFDIKAFAPSDLKQNNEILVILGFEVKNISSKGPFSVNPSIYEVYVDDMAATKNSLSGYSQCLDVSKLAIGKRAKGYWGANIPADTKKLEIHIKDGYGTDTSAVFILDVPPVESITPDEYFASID